MAQVKTADDVRRICKEKNIQFIRLQFTDILGMMKNIAITTDQLDRALNNEMMFDGSSIEGFVRIEESDMYLRPDISTFAELPWLGEYGIARMICDIYRPNGEPFEGDPRYVLRKALKRAGDMGYEFFVGPECEFFLFQTDEEGKPTTQTHDQASYFDLGPVDNGEIARIEMVEMLMKMGFDVEAAHHENAPGQHEIDFKYSDALRAADNIITFKLVVKVMAKKNGLHATFMPKPLNNECGNGMHCNMSLFKDGKNAFFDASDKNGLSTEAYHFVAGLLAHARAMAAVTNPLVNSYKRLVPGYEAPVYVTWSLGNRSPLIRVPVARGLGTRLEMRNPDPACNPYLALAAMLTAGLDGIEKKLDPPTARDENIYHMTEAERESLGIQNLPANLGEALSALQEDALVREALGAHVHDNLVKAKRIEWERYEKCVHDWEIERYLKLY